METFTKAFFFQFLILLLGSETCRAALKVHDKLDSGSDKILEKRQAPYYPQPPQAAPYYPPPPNYNNYPPPPAPYNYPQPNNNNYGYNGNNNYGYDSNNNYGYNNNNNYGYNGGGSNSGGYGYENQDNYGGSCYNSAKCNCYEPYNLYPCQAGSDPTSSEYSEYGYGGGYGNNDCACTEAHHPNGCTLVNCTTSTSVSGDPWCLCTTGASPDNCFGYFPYFTTQANSISPEEFQSQQIQQFQQLGSLNQQTKSDPQSLESSDTESDDQLPNVLGSDNLPLENLQGSNPLDALPLDPGLLAVLLSNPGLLDAANLDDTTGVLDNGLLSPGAGGGAQKGVSALGGLLGGQSLLDASLLDSSTTMIKQAPAQKVFKIVQ